MAQRVVPKAVLLVRVERRQLLPYDALIRPYENSVLDTFESILVYTRIDNSVVLSVFLTPPTRSLGFCYKIQPNLGFLSNLLNECSCSSLFH